MCSFTKSSHQLNNLSEYTEIICSLINKIRNDDNTTWTWEEDASIRIETDLEYTSMDFFKHKDITRTLRSRLNLSTLTLTICCSDVTMQEVKNDRSSSRAMSERLAKTPSPSPTSITPVSAPLRVNTPQSTTRSISSTGNLFTFKPINQ